MTRPRLRSTLAAVAALLFACAGGAAAQGTQPDLGSIKQVMIDADVSQPEIPLIQSPGNFKAYMIGGGIGAAIDQNEAGKAFREYMRRHNIDISKIVFESFKRVIEEDKTFALGAPADARLKLAVNNYGFGVAGLFGGNARRPLMNITASLVSNGGNVVWKKTEFHHQSFQGHRGLHLRSAGGEPAADPQVVRAGVGPGVAPDPADLKR
jgi:hypothetical protein